MEDKSSLIETLFERTQEYVKTSFELLKLQVFEVIADVVSSILSRLILNMIMFLCVIFLSIGVSFWLGEKLNNISYGFLIVAGFYAFAGIVFYLIFFKSIKKLISNSIIRKML